MRPVVGTCGCRPTLKGDGGIAICHSLVVTMTRAAFLLLGVISCIPLQSASALQCLGQDGKPVDWYIVYKMPKLRHKTGTEFGDGHAQFYLDGQRTQWTLSPKPVNETDHALYYTLQQIYGSKENSVLYMMFNDEKPSGSTTLSHGHAKGTLGFDTHSGFWLIHSAPRFPPVKKDGYEWAENASDFGQTFLCVSFAYKTLGTLAKQLLYYYPEIYDHYVPPDALSDFPPLADLLNNTKIQSPPYFSVSNDLSTLGGMSLVNFAKFTTFGADLYDALVAPTLKVPLLVESWQNGASAIVLPSNCSVQYEVYNVREVIMPGNLFFKEGKDHSKYAVSLTPVGWVCVGGINRESTQFKRAGGTMCFQNQQVWKAYLSIITFFEPCPHPQQEQKDITCSQHTC